MNVVYALWIFFLTFLPPPPFLRCIHTARPPKLSFLRNLYLPFTIISLAFFLAHYLLIVWMLLTIIYQKEKSFCVSHFLRRLLEIPFVNFDIKEKRFFISVWCVFVFFSLPLYYFFLPQLLYIVLFRLLWKIPNFGVSSLFRLESTKYSFTVVWRKDGSRKGN